MIIILIGYPFNYRYSPAWVDEDWTGKGNAWNYLMESSAIGPVDSDGKLLPVQVLLVDISYSTWKNAFPPGPGMRQAIPDPKHWEWDWVTLYHKNT